MAMTFQNIKIPFTNMSWTPDVPTSALGANEYNIGVNVETDTRGIKSVLGEQEILSAVPSGENPIFVTGGFRNQSIWWYIVATVQGRWYGITAAGITNITPGVGSNPSVQLPGYTVDMPITASWNGTTLFVNDSVNVPMYLLAADTEFSQYDTAPDNYVWNYNADWSSLSAGFMRLYSTPNVGSILVAGNLTADVISTGTTENYPYTVRWSQAFGLDSGPQSWEPTLQNVANELEVPVRGPVVDGFVCNGNFYVCSYWDTVVFQPYSYQSSTAPILGVRLLNQGRGLLNEACWAASDDVVYGLDARDIWVFNGQSFKPLGDQRVKNWFYENLNSTYWNRTFMINNTKKYQIEIYFPDLDSTGTCNQMISYRYDLDVWNPPRTIPGASSAAEGPIFTGNVADPASRTVVFSRQAATSQLVQKDIGNTFLGNAAINTEFRRDNVNFGQKYSNKVMIHRILPEVEGTGNITVTIGGATSVGSTPTFKPSVTMPIDTTNPWIQVNQNDFRVNTIKIESASTTDSWQLTAINAQFSIVEDDY